MIVKSKDVERVKYYEMTQEYFDDYIGNQTHYEGDLDVTRTNFTSLGKLETISGSLIAHTSKIKTLGNLEHVGGEVVSNRNMTSLGNLKRVDGKVTIYSSNITSLGNLEYAGGDLYLSHKTNLTSLGNLEHVVGEIRCSSKTTTLDLLLNSKFKDQLRVR